MTAKRLKTIWLTHVHWENIQKTEYVFLFLLMKQNLFLQKHIIIVISPHFK